MNESVQGIKYGGLNVAVQRRADAGERIPKREFPLVVDVVGNHAPGFD